ncbi:MAG: hypothetical protein JRI68_33925, partial [Deltaproteobacteria bacterium]|nr:hypothetical protein [Deltaproteobacteria bacterium]
VDVGAPDSQLEDATIVAGILQQQTVLAFRLNAAEGEYVELSELPIRTTLTDGTATIRAARLFLDSDGDGFVDHDTEWSTPLAETTETGDDGTVVFRDVRVPAGTDAQFLVTYEVLPGAIDQDPGAAPPSSGANEPGGNADEQGVPLTILTLLATGLLGVALRRRRQVVFGGALAATIAMAGCSLQMSDESEPQPTIVTGPSATVSHSASLQTRLVVADVAAEGVTSGAELEVSGADVAGPTITVTN